MCFSPLNSEDTGWVLLICLPVPSPEPGMQQFPKYKCGGFPELALPFLAGLVI